MEHIRGIIDSILNLHTLAVQWRRVLVVLAAVVVFATTYALILPAITLNRDTANNTPGINLDAPEKTSGQHQLTAKVKDDDGKVEYTVYVTYGDDAGLPDGTKLKASKVKSASVDYQDAKDAVIAAKKKADSDFKTDDLGFAALDITLVDSDGNKVEPTGDVSVKIAMHDLSSAAATNGVTVQHIVKKTDLQTADEGEDTDDDSSSSSSSEASSSSASSGKSGAAAADAAESESGSSASDTSDDKADADNADADANDKDSSGAGSSAPAKSASSASSTSSSSSSSSSKSSSTTTDVPSVHGLVAQGVGGKTNVDSSAQQGTAEFTVSSFSTFTITWTKGTSDTTRIGSVKLLYVTGDGLEKDLASSETISATDLAQTTGGFVTLSEWGAKALSDSSYTYDHAVIGSRSGTTITGVKVDGADETKKVQSGYDEATKTPIYTDVTVTAYKLYYTTDATPSENGNWEEYTDSTSDNSSTDANIYLVYTTGGGSTTEPVPVTFHFLTLDSQEIKDGDGNAITKVIDGSTLSSDTDLIAWGKVAANVPNGYVLKDASGINNGNPYTNSRVTLENTGDTTGGNLGSTYFRWLKYDSSEKAMYAGRNNPANYDSPGKITNGNNIYMTLQPTSLSVTVHRIDASGNKIADDVTYTMATSGGGSVSLTDSDLETSGYTVSKGYYDWQGQDAPGTEFASMTYNLANASGASPSNNTVWKSSYTADASATDSTATDNLETELWVVYEPQTSMDVTVHHVNQLGAEIASPTTQSVTSGGSITADSLDKLSGRTSNYSYSTHFMDGDTQQSFASLAYEYNTETGTWSSSYKETDDATASTTTDSAVNDVYLVYTPTTLGTITFHHVDESGGTLHADTTYTAGSWSGWNGYTINGGSFIASGIGSYQNGYAGAFGQNTVPSGYALQYMLDSGTYHTGTASTAKETGSTHTEFLVDGNPVLLTDVWQVYSGYKGVTVHHVDENGKKLADDTYATVSADSPFTGASQAQDIDGYGYKESRFGGASGTDGTAFTNLTYSYDSSQTDTTKRWSSTYVNTDTLTPTSTGDVVNEVWVVYAKGSTNQVFTVHYQSLDSSGKATDAIIYRDNTSTNASSVTKVASSSDGSLTVTPLDSNSTQTDSWVESDVRNSGGAQLTYMNTRLGSATGPNITGVEVNSKGQIIYHTDMTVSASPVTNTVNVTQWAVVEQAGTQSGRSFTITKADDGNLTLTDTQNGSINLNQANEAGTATASDGSTVTQPVTYAATFHGENVTTEYTVTQGTSSQVIDGQTYDIPYYTIEISESLKSTNTDIYQVYTDPDSASYTDPSGGSSDGSIWIEDDMKYSGLYRVVMSSGTIPSKATNVSYAWHRITTSGSQTVPTASSLTANDDTNTYPASTRKQTGDHWNMAYSESERTWLDIEAEEGEDTWTADSTISYYVTLTYTTAGGTTVTLRSEPVTVKYYGQLENGDFETPQYTSAINQLTNSEYADSKGVWQSTGVGTESGGRENVSIEIVNTSANSSSFASSYAWNTEGDVRYKTDADGNYILDSEGNTIRQYAKDGDQFAELNCSSAGALYQDVITHPNETLSYWFSHRARGVDNGSTPEYDTMYLVIMPTELAMTSGPNNTELTDQSDLIDFINEHGGFSYNRVTSGEQDEITYNDTENGILIRKVTSDDQDWHDITGISAYTAKGGTTRFFFVAGPTSWQQGGRYTESGSKENVVNATHGNFLDAVGFSQSLPDTEGFNFRVSKTFTGLTQAQVAALASNNNVDKPFKLTITNKYTASGGSDKSNDALNNAVLQFTAEKTGSGTNDYIFTPTATQGTTNLFKTAGNTGAVRVNDDGSITMTWTFTNQSLPSDASDQQFNYTVSEDQTNAKVDGYTVTPTVSASVGQTWRQFAAATISGSTITASSVNDSTSLTTVTAGTEYQLSSDVNLIIAQVSDGKTTGYTVWSNSELSADQKTAVIEYINSDDRGWAISATASATATLGQNGHVEYRSGTDQGNITYDSSNPGLYFAYTAASEGSSIAYLRFTNAATQSGYAATRTIRQGNTANYAFTDTYREKSSSQITVQKVFSGTTWTTVDKLLKAGYAITVTKTQDDEGNAIAEADQPSLKLNQTTSTTNSNVSYTTSTDASTGKVTLTWVIRELAPDDDTGANTRMGGPGTYSVEESGFTPTEAQGNNDNNSLTAVTVNGKSLDVPSDATTNADTKISQGSIHVGKVEGQGTTYPSIRGDDQKTTGVRNVDTSATTTLDNSTNLIIAQMKYGSGSNDYYYLAWTRSAAGANLRQAIVDYINGLDGMGTGSGGVTATLKNVDFQSGSNPGAMYYDSNNQDFAMVYDVTTQGETTTSTLSFSDDTDSSHAWIKYYAAEYTVNNGTDDDMTTNDTEIRIANSYEPIVKISKVSKATSEGDTVAKLSGAVFRVYKYDTNNTTKLYYLTTSTGTDAKFAAVDVSKAENTSGTRVDSTSSEKKALSFTTGDDGLITIGALPNPPSGSTMYYLEEVTAPAGYNKVTDIPFVVNADGTVQLVGSDEQGNPTYSAEVDPAKVTWNDPYYTITVADTSGVELPNTGGSGDIAFRITGIALIAAALAGAWFLRRRQA